MNLEISILQPSFESLKGIIQGDVKAFSSREEVGASTREEVLTQIHRRKSSAALTVHRSMKYRV